MTTSRRLSLLLPVLLLAACQMWQSAPPDNATSSSSAASVQQLSGPVMIGWKMVTTEDTQAVPHTSLTLELTGGMEHTVDLGSYTGSDGGKPDVAGALLTKTLWFAGGGDQFAVFRETNAAGETVLTVKRRGVDEEQTADQPWEVFTVIPIPANATIQVSADAESSAAMPQS